MTAATNWLHLDCKGTMPSVGGLCRWLDRFAEQGFDGIVWEYENRLPWQNWPGTFEAGYSLAQWRQVWGHCRELGLAVMPLVQTLGHLEWLLKHETYAHLAEHGLTNALCPQHPQVLPRLIAWLDEVIDLHPDSALINLGADEVWALASCKRCRRVAERSGDGALGVYLEHVGRLCEHVVARGRRPAIWADMFKNHDAFEAVRHLPEQVVLVDWDYAPVPRCHSEALGAQGHEVWGGSAVRCGFEQKFALPEIGTRLANVAQWQQILAEGRVAALMHTTWARGDSLRPMYGPWDGWLPAFIAAGNAERWPGHVLQDLIEPLDKAMIAPEWIDLTGTIERIGSTGSDDSVVGHCLRWWTLALRHRQLFWATVEHTLGYLGLEAGEPYRGAPDKFLTLLQRGTQSGVPMGPVRTLIGDLPNLRGLFDGWERDVRAFWLERELSDVDEYLASRLGNLREALTRVRQPS